MPHFSFRNAIHLSHRSVAFELLRCGIGGVKVGHWYRLGKKGRKPVDELTREQGAAQCFCAAWKLVPLLTRQLSLITENKEMNLTTDLHYFFFNISCNNTGSLVVMKSTPWLMSHSISLASFTVQALTFMPRS